MIKGQTKKLGEIIIENKKSILRSKGNTDGVYPFFVSGFNVKNIDKYILSGKSIFLPTGGNFFVHYFDGKCSYSTDTWAIKTNDNTDVKFLYYFLVLNQDFISKKLFKGATIKHLQKDDFRKIEILIPPIKEQKRIVKILDDTFDKVVKVKENAEKNLQNSKELFESYLQNIFANPGKDWQEKKFGEVYDVRDGTHDSPTYQKEGFPLVTSKNLKNDSLDFGNIKYILEKDYIKINERSNVDKGDILFAMIGTIGSPVVVEVEPSFAIKNVALFKVPKTQNNYFLKYYLDSKFVIDKMTIESKGTTQKFVGLGYLRNFKINLPPLTEQKTIVKKLDMLLAETKKLEAIYKQKLADLEELKKSILQTAFAGKL